MTHWTQTQLTDLKSLYAKGLSYSEIAEALNKKYGGSISRNAIAGKVHWMTLRRSERVNRENKQRGWEKAWLIRGGMPKGEEHPRAKLSDSDVADIRQRVGGYGSQAELAEEYGVTPSTISAIKRRVLWKHVE